MRLDYTLRKIIAEVSEELGIEEDTVERVVKSQYKFLELKIKETFGSGKYFTVSFNYFGKFLVKEKRSQILKDIKKQKIDEVMDFIKQEDADF